jgi:hypothetical protein
MGGGRCDAGKAGAQERGIGKFPNVVHRRAYVAHVRAKLLVPERFACRVLDQHRLTQRKALQKGDAEAALTADISDFFEVLRTV